MAVGELEEAAHTAVLGVRALRERVGEAREGCEESSRRVGQLSQGLASDREALHKTVAELDQAVEDSAKQLSDDVAAAESELGELATASQEAGTQGQQTFEAESSALKGLGHHLREIDNQVDALAEAADDETRAALDRAKEIAESLGDAIDDAEKLLTELASGLGDLATEVHNTTVAVRSVLRDHCLGILQDKETDFAAKTDEVRVVIERVFFDLARHAGEVTEYGVEKLGALLSEQADALEVRALTAGNELENLAGFATKKKEEIQGMGTVVTDRQQATGERALAVAEALGELRLRWAAYGF